MKFSTKIQIALFTVLAAFSLVACDNGGGIVDDVVKDASTAVYYAEQTVEVSTEMIESTVNGKGVFSCPNGCD